MTSIYEEISAMTIGTVSDNIVVDMKNCWNPTSYKIVLLNIIRLRVTNKTDKTRNVEILINDSERRHFEVPESIDAEILRSKLLADNIIKNFMKM